jgi:hypothetical protein
MEDNYPYPAYREFNGGLLSCRHETLAIGDLGTGVKLNHVPGYRKLSKAPTPISALLIELDITLKRGRVIRAQQAPLKRKTMPRGYGYQ